MRVDRFLISLLIICLGAINCGAQTFPVSVPPAFSAPADAPYHLSESRKAVKVSTDVILCVLPSAALIGTLCARDWKGLLQGAETAAATLAATYILKYSVREWRPDHTNRHSFPSGHTAITFASAAYLQRRYGWAYGAPAYALSCYVGWGRVFARKHHWWDVVAGGAIGAGSAYIFTRPFARKHNLQISPVSDGTSIGVYASMEF